MKLTYRGQGGQGTKSGGMSWSGQSPKAQFYLPAGSAPFLWASECGPAGLQ